MTILNQTLGQLRVNDPVIQQVVLGYAQANSVVDFLAPTVTVDERAGKIVKFDKSNMAVLDTRRAPGSLIQQVVTGYNTEDFVLRQHAASGVVYEEEYQEALNGEARVDLRINAARRAAEAIAQSWEAEAIATVTDSTAYEASCTAALAGTAKFSDPGSDPERTVQACKEAVRAQLGVYPDAAVISSDVFNALKFHPLFRDRVKYTSSGSINLDMLATWFDLPQGIRVAQRLKYDPATNVTTEMMPSGTMLLFFKGSNLGKDANGQLFVPVNGADRAKPAFAYTYLLRGYPIATKERFNEDRRAFITDVITEQRIVPTGMGDTGKIGAGFLLRSVV